MAELRSHALARVAEGATIGHVTAEAAPPPIQPAVSVGTDLALRELLSLQHHTIALVNGLIAQQGAGHAAPGQQAHVDYLDHRLAAAEVELGTARSFAARLAGELSEQQALAAERAVQVAALQATQGAQATALAAMATEAAGNRQFMAQAVDTARGETRTARERCAQLELQLKDKEREADMYRQRALAVAPAPAASRPNGASQ